LMEARDGVANVTCVLERFFSLSRKGKIVSAKMGAIFGRQFNHV